MDIGALSIAMSLANVQQEVGIAVVKMAMNADKENGSQATELMKNVALDPNLGNNIDITI